MAAEGDRGDRLHFPHLTRSTAGGFQMPSMITFGQYNRMTRLNESFGAGSQFDSLSLPGDWFWTYSVSDPSSLNFSLSRSPIAYRSIGLSTKNCFELYMVIDQNAPTGGSWPFGKWIVYRFAPLSGFPSESTFACRVDRVVRSIGAQANERDDRSERHCWPTMTGHQLRGENDRTHIVCRTTKLIWPAQEYPSTFSPRCISRKIVGATGFEPVTSCSQGRRVTEAALRPAVC